MNRHDEKESFFGWATKLSLAVREDLCAWSARQGWEARAKLTDSAEAAIAVDELIAAAKAVIERWDSPLWKNQQPTAELIHVLRKAVANAEGEA